MNKNHNKPDEGAFDARLSGNQPLIMKVVRGIIMAAALLVAHKLILISYDGLINFATSDANGRLLTLITSYAWLAFISMGGYWILDKRIGNFIPVTGTAAGVISIILCSAVIIIMPVILLILVPLIKFAYHLVKFHYEHNPH